jgi:hypothetical protein
MIKQRTLLIIYVDRTCEQQIRLLNMTWFQTFSVINLYSEKEAFVERSKSNISYINNNSVSVALFNYGKLHTYYSFET